jgi:hypothetical protein
MKGKAILSALPAATRVRGERLTGDAASFKVTMIFVVKYGVADFRTTLGRPV